MATGMYWDARTRSNEGPRCSKLYYPTAVHCPTSSSDSDTLVPTLQSPLLPSVLIPPSIPDPEPDRLGLGPGPGSGVKPHVLSFPPFSSGRAFPNRQLLPFDRDVKLTRRYEGLHLGRIGGSRYAGPLPLHLRPPRSISAISKQQSAISKST